MSPSGGITRHPPGACRDARDDPSFPRRDDHVESAARGAQPRQGIRRTKGVVGDRADGREFLLIGVVGLATESRDELGGTLTFVAGVREIAGSVVGKGEWRVGETGSAR